MQSGPGSEVSALLVTSLSPFATCCGFRLLKAPSPHPLWSTREQKLRVGMKKAGTVNPADPQQPQFPVPTPVQHCAGVPEPVQFAGSPGVPGHGLTLLPHAMHAICSQHVGQQAALACGAVRPTPRASTAKVVRILLVVMSPSLPRSHRAAGRVTHSRRTTFGVDILIAPLRAALSRPSRRYWGVNP